MAEVFRAETMPVAGVTREVAIKRLVQSDDPEAARMFADEAAIWLRLRHPNIVPVIELGEAEGSLFLALELIDGFSAFDLVERGGPLPVPLALCVVERLSRALDHAHELGIVHRDVKPANILLSTRGEVFLTDFGIARAADRTTRTQTGVLKGSVTTLSPEQVLGRTADARSDLFALGATLHFLLTGTRLFDGPTQVVLARLGNGVTPEPPQHLPPPVRSLLARLVEFDRERRASSAAEVGREIRSLLPLAPEELEKELAERIRLVREGNVPPPDRAADRPTRKSRSSRDAETSPVVKRSPAPAPPERPIEISARFPAAPPPRVEPLPKQGLTGFFELAPISRSAKKAVARVGPSRVGFFACLALAVAGAAILWGPAAGKLRRADCATTRIAIDDTLRSRGPAAAADSARGFASKCPRESDGGLLAVRLLTLAGKASAAREQLPPRDARTDADHLAAAAIDFFEREWKRAEETALAVAKDAGPLWPQAACLSAAAALNQDRPDRAETYLKGVPSDCGRILGAAALAQRGDRRGARQLLAERSSDVSLDAARESALGVLDLLAGDMEAAAADALAATSSADADRLSPRPWIWYLQPSPRGADQSVLRIAGPFDDAGLYTKVLEGDCARARGSLDLAMKRYDDAGARGGRTSLADLRAASVLVQQGRPQPARGRLARALETDPGWAPALVALALIEERDNPKLAALHAAAALATEPENKDARRIAGSSAGSSAGR